MDQATLEHFKTIGELLMGAAHADGKLVGHERDRVNEILGAIIPEHEELSALNAHLESFDPGAFDPKVACERLPGSADARREVLQALAEITDADGIQDLTESDYIRMIAGYLGLTDEDWSSLAFDIVSARPAEEPPPLPDSGD
jgi:uncharacterized tellurite resistance protein B-like protein